MTALNVIQNKYLRRATREYKRTLRAALEKKTQVIPINLYIEVVISQRAVKIREYKVKLYIARAADAV